MTRKPLTALTLAAFLATSVMPAMPAVAAGFDGMPDMRYNPYGAHAQTRGATAGAYIRIPFKGGLKRPTEEMRLGLALSTRLSGQYHDPGRFAAIGTPRLIDLSVGLQSFGRQPLADSVQFNGLSINRINALYADEDGEKKKGSILKTGLIVIGVAAVGLGVALAIHCSSTSSEEIGGC